MPEILTPDEIAALTAAFAADAPAAERAPAGAVRTIDLANQERSLEGRLPGLELVLERFARGLRSPLAMCLGDVPSIRTASVGLVRFARLAPLLAEPAGLVRFRLAQLRGQGILTIPSPLVAALLQVSCGGAARGVTALPTREFSPVEVRLIERLASRILDELEAAWEPVAPVGCTLIQVDTMPLFAAVAAPEDLVMHADLSVVVSGLAPFTLTLVIPNAALDPIRARLRTVHAVEEGTAISPDARWMGAMHARLLDVPVDVAVELGTTEMTVSRLLELSPGDVLPLDVGREGPVVVRVAGEPHLYGAPGVQGGHNAVRIIERP